MRLVWPGAVVLSVAFWGVAAADDDGGLKPPSRSANSASVERQERDRVLDMAQQLRSKAGGLHDKADEFREKGKDDQAGKLDDQGDALEERADQMDEDAEELDEAASSKGSATKIKPPQRD